jgi:uncharacterized protein YndB with AHSA1/START domain
VQVGASSRRAAINAPPAKVYAALTDGVGGWWDPAHTFSHNSRNLSLDAKPGGCFCERLPDGGGVQHMSVVYASPGKLLRLTGSIGPSSTECSAASWPG